MVRTHGTKDGKPCWVFTKSGESPQVGDRIGFTCNGKGRGGHYHVTAIVTKAKAKTFDATEADKSYNPGTLWNVRNDSPNLYLYKD